MVSVTDLAYREICRKAGAGMAYTEMIYINIDNCFSPYPIKNEHEWYVAEEDTHKTKEHKHTWLFYPSFRGTNDHYFCNGCSITSKEKPT